MNPATHLYGLRSASPEDCDRQILELVGNAIKAYAETIDSNEWPYAQSVRRELMGLGESLIDDASELVVEEPEPCSYCEGRGTAGRGPTG